MNCKNCQTPLEDDAQFCNYCGAKVIKSRITFKELIALFIDDIFGVDSRFFRTLKEMAIHPDRVLNEYLSGVRRRYVNPFAFMAVAVGISLIVFKYYEQDFLDFNSEFNKESIEAVKKDAEVDLSQYKNLSKEELKKKELKKSIAQNQLKFMDGYMNFMLNYYNIMMFLFLPFYAMLSKWTYRKPHNYGEHIIMNTYIIGFTTFGSLIFFGLALLINPKIYSISFLFTVLFYLFALGKLYKNTFWQHILKLLRFSLGLLIIFVIIMLIAMGVGIVMAATGMVKM